MRTKVAHGGGESSMRLGTRAKMGVEQYKEHDTFQVDTPETTS